MVRREQEEREEREERERLDTVMRIYRSGMRAFGEIKW